MEFSNMKTSTLFLKYVIPQMIGLVFNSIYFIVDGVFIGRKLGTAALAAAGAAVPVVEVIIAVSMLIAVGTGIIISNLSGKADNKAARNVFNISIKLSIVIALVIAVLGVVFVYPLSRALGASDVILEDTATYLRYFLTFSPFLIFSFALSTYARNDGKPGLAMWSLTIGSLSNIVLDYILMYHFNMGIAGAALATGLGPVFSVIILLPHFLRKKGNLYFEKAKFGAGVIAKILVNGMPAFVAEFSIGFVTLLYNLSIVKNGLGDNGLASYVVIGYAALICLTSFLGAAQGVQPAVSYYFGANQQNKIKDLFKATNLFNVGLGVVFYILLFFGGKAFFSIFITDNPELLSFTVEKSRIYFLCLPFAAVNILMISFLQSMGRVKYAMWISLLRCTIPVFVLLTVLPMLFVNGMWVAIIGVEIIASIAAVLLWKNVSKKYKKLKLLEVF